jgi:hypothetical protein
MRNALTEDVIIASTNISSAKAFTLVYSNNGAPFAGSYFDSTTILEMEWWGSDLTEAQFATFQTIMNTYFASL